jgi:hypothetical protein
MGENFSMNISNGVPDPRTMDTHYDLSMSRNDVIMLGKEVYARVIEEVSKKITEDFLKLNSEEILSQIDPRVIADMVKVVVIIKNIGKL